MNTCINCEELIEQVGTLWVHRPNPGTYKVACLTWGYVATPAKPVSDAE